ncbi:MAG TPA: hypothetical protein DEQ47_07315 [Solibacterales bacterium]|nr:hypothetical protein [Bryobacterales bacterium]
MWSDNESDKDLLGFSHLQAAVLSIIENHDLLPTTIGVFGDWGSGKSSLIGMIRSELEEKDGVVVLQFNGWVFEGYEGAKTMRSSSRSRRAKDWRVSRWIASAPTTPRKIP